MEDEIEVNLPFERIPVCACDPGKGQPPTRKFMLECRLKDGPCAAGYYDRHPEANIPATPKEE